MSVYGRIWRSARTRTRCSDVLSKNRPTYRAEVDARPPAPAYRIARLSTDGVHRPRLRAPSGSRDLALPLADRVPPLQCPLRADRPAGRRVRRRRDAPAAHLGRRRRAAERAVARSCRPSRPSSRRPGRPSRRHGPAQPAASPVPAPPVPPPATNAETASAIEPTSFWAKTKRETAIWSGWDSNAKEFAKIASDLTVQVLELRGAARLRLLPRRQQGPQARRGLDRSRRPSRTWPGRAGHAPGATPSCGPRPRAGSEELLRLQRGNYVETTGEFRGRWAQAFFLIDHRPGEWAVGWVDGLDLTLPRGEQAEISNYMLSRTTLMTSAPELWLKVPYRTQLDGSSYAEANCGPTSVAMALEAIGKRDSLESLRSVSAQAPGHRRLRRLRHLHPAPRERRRGARRQDLRPARRPRDVPPLVARRDSPAASPGAGRDPAGEVPLPTRPRASRSTGATTTS